MATNCPSSIEVVDIQFKKHSKYRVGTDITNSTDNYNLLASASSFGLVILANVNPPELRVILLNHIVEQKNANVVPARIVPLQGVPKNVALSCDHSQLAVDINVNGQSFISIFAVASFLTANTAEILRIPVETNSTVTHILWNPVTSNTMAVCFNHGGLDVYVLKNAAFEMFTIDRSQQTKCASWSPKGKQLVVGFANGKLAQYKPNLSLAKEIPCPPNIYPQPFDIIALQWLSTYQFAAVFLSKTPDASPALHIINAPKVGPPMYINYDDICYSQTNPRNVQVYLTYILQWNLLLVGCSNSMEIGVLGTTETSENPTWKQYMMLDEGRAELPLTDNLQETYPVGMVLETGSVHQLTENEKVLPAMPMFHIISTDGLLLSFNLLNTRPNFVSINSPPPPLSNPTVLTYFKALPAPANVTPVQQSTPPSEPVAPASYSNFGSPLGVTSTPAPKPKSFFSGGADSSTPLFGSATANASPLFGGATSNEPSIFGKSIQTTPTSASVGFAQLPKPVDHQQPQQQQQQQQSSWPSMSSGSIFGGNASSPKTSNSLFGGNGTAIGSVPTANTGSFVDTQLKSSPQIKPSSDSNADNKPFLTVAPIYNPPAVTKSTSGRAQHPVELGAKDDDIDSSYIINKLIQEDVQSFENLLSKLIGRCQKLEVKTGSREESISAQKQLNDLTNIVSQAVESTDELTSEIQSLKLSINETFSMVEEAKSRMAIDDNCTMISMCQTSRRQSEKLHSMLTVNEHQLDLISKEIDGQWSAHQLLTKQNSKNKMYVPTLESVYQTLSKQREILNRQKIRINYLKTKLGVKETFVTGATKQDISINSLSESLLSMTLADQIKSETGQLSAKKIQSIREILKGRKVVPVIKPQRPNRKGLNSEVVVEKRIAQAKKSLGKTAILATETKQQNNAAKVSIIKPQPQTPDPITGLTQMTTQLTPKATTQQLKNEVKPIAKPLAVSSAPTLAFGGNVQNPNKESFQPAINLSKPSSTIGTTPKMDEFKISSQSTAFSFGSGAGLPKFGDGFAKFGDGFSLSKTADSKSFGFVSNDSGSFGKDLQNPDKLEIIPIPPVSKNQPSKSAETSVFMATTKPTNSSETSTMSTVAKNVTPFNATGFNKPQSETISFGAAPPPLVPITKSSSIFGGSAIASPIPFGSKAQFDNIAQPSAVKPIEPTADAIKIVTPKPNEKSVDKENVSSLNVTSAGQKPPQLQDDTANAKAIFNSIQKPIQADVSSSSGATIVFSSPTSSFAGFNAINPKSDATTISGGGQFGSPPSTNAISAPSVAAPLASTKPASTTTTAPTSSFTFSLPGLPNSAPTLVKPSSTPATASSTANSFSFASFAQSTTPTNTASASSAASNQPDNLFQGLNICKPTTPADKPIDGATNLFSLNSFNATATPSDQTTSIFGGGAMPAAPTSISSPASGFGFIASPNVTVTTPSATTVSSSLFGGGNALTTTQASSGGNLFGSPTATATPSTANSSPFGGGFSSLFGQPTSNSTNAFNSTGGSIFGGAADQSKSANIFGGANAGTANPSNSFNFTAAANNAPTGNIFSQNAAPTSTSGSMFGGSTAFGSQQQTNSIFGGGGGNPTASSDVGFPQTGGAFSSGVGATGSPFAQFNQNNQTGGFGTNTSGGNIFGGGGAAVAAQQPAFGSTAPVFGAAPEFGGAPIFGTPKTGFGTFANVNVSPPPGAGGNAKSSLFETLGSSETSMTFGNIAQNANASKPAFVSGSSFSSWR